MIENELEDHCHHFIQLSKELGNRFQNEDNANDWLDNETQKQLNEVEVKLQLASEKAKEKRKILEETLLSVSC